MAKVFCSDCGKGGRTHPKGMANPCWCRACYLRYQAEYKLGLRRGAHSIQKNEPPVRSDAGCLIWQGIPDHDGYGRMKIGNMTHRAHRIYYERFNGPILAGNTVDHLCEVKLCVEPTHLDQCTPEENIRRYWERRRAREALAAGLVNA